MTARPPRIGHNQGPPLDPMQSWRRHCWKAARAALFRPLPLETVRRRVRRAAQLGFAYRRYEQLVIGAGEIRALLVAGDTLLVTAPHANLAARPDPAALAKLAAVTGCRRLLLAGPDGPETLWDLPGPAAALFEAAIHLPSAPPLAAPPLKADRVALAEGLRRVPVPAGTVALVGEGAHGPAWAAAARLAGFVAAAGYFAGGS